MKKLFFPLMLLLLIPAVSHAFRHGHNLEPFDWRSVQVPMKKGICFFNKASADVQEFSKFAIDRLVQMAEANKSKCEPMLNQANIVQKNVTTYFDNIYSEKGITRDDGDMVMQLNCNNAEEVFRLQLFNYRLHVHRGRLLEAPDLNIFYGHCRDEQTKNLKEGVENLDQCLKDVLAEALRDYREDCHADKEGIRNMAQTWRNKLKVQEEAMNNSHLALKKIFELAESENCQDAQDVAKAAVQSAITIGANVLGTAFGGPVAGIGASIGAEAINFMINYLFKLAETKSTLQQLISDKNYENSVCMFLSLQEKMCQQFSIIPPEPVEKRACGLRDQEKDKQTPGLDIINEFAKLSTFQNLGTTAEEDSPEPAYQVALQDIMEVVYQKPTNFPGSKKEGEGSKVEKPLTIHDIMTEAEPFFKKQNLKDFNSLLRIKKSLQTGKRYLEHYDIISKDEDDEKINARKKEIMEKYLPKDSLLLEQDAQNAILKKMGQTLKDIEKDDLPHLMEIFLTSKVKGDEGLEKLLAEEMALEIYKSFTGKLDSYLDNVDSLQDINNATVELMKPIFRQKLWDRYKTSLQNARVAEKTHLAPKVPLTNQELRRRRLATFAQMRDTLKDCLSTQSAFFSHRSKPNIFQALFSFPQVAANLDISPIPKRYLRACGPFMCNDGGIPIPKLTNPDEAPIHFQIYSCGVLNQAEDILRKMRNIYLDSGKICGKTVHEITGDGKTKGAKFHPGRRNVADLQEAILSPDESIDENNNQQAILMKPMYLPKNMGPLVQPSQKAQQSNQPSGQQKEQKEQKPKKESKSGEDLQKK